MLGKCAAGWLAPPQMDAGPVGPGARPGIYDAIVASRWIKVLHNAGCSQITLDTIGSKRWTVS